MDDSRAVLEEWDVEDEWAHPATWSDTRLREETTTQQRERWLIAAVAVGDVRFMRRLLHLGMSAHSQYKGYTLLHIALHMNDVSAVQALCEYGADPYAIGQGWTPMQIALNHTFGNINIARMLLRTDATYESSSRSPKCSSTFPSTTTMRPVVLSVERYSGRASRAV